MSAFVQRRQDPPSAGQDCFPRADSGSSAVSWGLWSLPPALGHDWRRGPGAGSVPSPGSHLPRQEYVCTHMSHAASRGPPCGGYYLASQALKTKGLRKPQPLPRPPVMALEDSQFLCPSPTRGIWSRWKVPPHTQCWNHFTSPCPPGSSQPDHQLTRTVHAMGRGRRRGRPELPPLKLPRAKASTLPSLRELGEKHPSQDGRSGSGAPWGPAA